MKTKKRFLSILLSLALMLGLMPGMSLTAWAATAHNIAINNAQNGSVTASVNGSTVTSAEEGATVTLTANPANGYRLKSISGTYMGNVEETLNTGSSNGTYFTVSATKHPYQGWWCLHPLAGANSNITISSKNSGSTIYGAEFTICYTQANFDVSKLSVNPGQLERNGTTLLVKSVNANSFIVNGGGSDQGCAVNSVKISGTGPIDLALTSTDNPNVKTFIMPVMASGNVSITAVFEELPKYNVTISGATNAVANGGSTSQTGLIGAMTPVVYTANEGYYFPENYSVEAVNGISVTRNSYTQITVSGTPTGNAEITLTAPTAKTTPDAPTTATATDCTTADNNDGTLTGVTTAMEYKKSDAADWTAGTGSDITGLVPGTYYVRVKATDTTNASANQELTIKGFISYTVTFKVVNGKWNEGEGDAATADKTVTLTGHDGDTLKLTADQIPAVGSKPNDTYKAGSWDVTPSTDTAITEATTYTYTYVAKEASVVTKEPEAKTLTYTGSAQELVTAGTATGGEMQYALGTATKATEPYTASIPTKTEVGT